MTTFLLLKRFDYHVILNVGADFIVARVYAVDGQKGPYRVTSGVGPSNSDVGIVKSLDDAIRPSWTTTRKIRCSGSVRAPTLYWRHTISVSLRVKRDQQNHC